MARAPHVPARGANDLWRDPALEPLWPTPAQLLLLRAAVLNGPAGVDAWLEWRSRHDLVEAELDHGSFRLLPLVYKNLVGQNVKEPHLPRLKGIYRYWWCSNQDLFYRTAGLLEHLHAAGVRTMLLKGAATSLLYYEDAGVRPMADVDVLVPFEQVRAAVECLKRLGWRAATGLVEEEILYRHSTPMVNDAGREFDLHWHALREGLHPRADAAFWRRSVPLTFLKVPTRGLAPADALLHTIVHGMRWNEEPTIRWIADAMTIIGQGERVNWDAVLYEAQARRVQLRVMHGLGYLRQMFDAPIPEAAWARLCAAPVSRLEQLEFRYLAVRSKREQRDRVANLVPMLGLEYLRVTTGQHLWERFVGLPGFLRYRLRGRNEPVVNAARRAARWLGLGRGHAARSGDLHAREQGARVP